MAAGCLLLLTVDVDATPLCGVQMDRILKEERNYILQMVKKIRASGANVLLIQKSILRDAVTDLSLHYLVCLDYACTVAGYTRDSPQSPVSCNWLCMLLPS